VVRKRSLRLFSIIVGLVVVIGSVAGALMILIPGMSQPDGVYIEYPVKETYASTHPWTPPNNSYGVVFVDSNDMEDSVKFRENEWKGLLQLFETEKPGNVYVVRVACTSFRPLDCREATAQVTLTYYEQLVYYVTGGGLAYPPSLIIVYNNGTHIRFVDLIVPKFPGPTEPMGIYQEIMDAIHRDSSQSPQ